ncbi:MAG: mannosyltransferase family protein [Solirubrobacteraceae bacterium]
MTTISAPVHDGVGGRLHRTARQAVKDPLARRALLLYLASRLVLLAISGLDLLIHHASLRSQMAHWDGKWYLLTSEHWYYHHIFDLPDQWTTLGFMPLYPSVMWVVAQVTRIGYFGAGITVSLVCGALATVLVGRLARAWWGDQAARRVLAFWCFFPGTIVFSMVYSEGLTLVLVLGAMIALSRKSWVRAGVLAGFSTAVAPVALSSVVVCAAAAVKEFYARGIRLTRSAPLQVLRDRDARRALLAPLISPFGTVGFAIFLWFWTGSPLADYRAQHGAWQESTTPLAIPDDAGHVLHEIFVSGVGKHGPGGIDLNKVVAVLGALVLLWGLWLLWKARREVPLPALVWTVCIAALTLTSSNTPPNPRMLMVAFPVVMVLAAKHSGSAYRRLMVVNVLAFLVMSPLTYVGYWLRP